MKHVQILHLALLSVLVSATLACDFLQLFGPTETPVVVAPSSTPLPLHATPSQAVPSPTTSVTVVAFDSLYLREGPSMQYAASNEVLKWGERLTFDGSCVMDATGTWWLRVRAGARSGWVSQRYVTPRVCGP